MNLAFDIQAAGFSLSNARACAEASRLAYDEPPTIASDWNHVRVIDCGPATVVAFRGTASIRDAITDARVLRENHIHKGFVRAYNSIAIDLMNELAKFPDEKPLFFTGHSLGGAQAMIAGWFFKEHYPHAHVYTFGQPRVGDSAFARKCESALAGRYWRIVHQEDIVPRVPLWIMGYRHSGQEVYFPSLGPMRFGAPLWFKLLSDLYGLHEQRWNVAEMVTDHSVMNYIRDVTTASI